MSQEKMERYQDFKKNRKELLAKEKKAKKNRKIAGIAAAAVVGLAILGALGVTGYNYVSDLIQAKPQYERSEMIIADIAGVLESEEASSEEASK